MDAKTPGRPSAAFALGDWDPFAAIFCSNYLLMFAYRQVGNPTTRPRRSMGEQTAASGVIGSMGRN